MIFEVFRQEKKGQAFAHAGSVEAPDAGFAEAWAREQYGRRGESVALWLVRRDAFVARKRLWVLQGWNGSWPRRDQPFPWE